MEKFFIPFQLPKKKNTQPGSSTKAQHLVAVLDSSGSMSSVWKHVADIWNKLIDEYPNTHAIAFSNHSYNIKGKVSEKINDYEGGGTEIFQGIKELTTYLSTFKGNEKIAVLFVSDGGDNQQATLKTRLQTLKAFINKKLEINFLSIGVGTGFPTFIAMDLREMFHNGDETISPVFLVEKTDFESFNDQFELVRQTLGTSSKLKVEPPVYRYPWSQKVISKKILLFFLVNSYPYLLLFLFNCFSLRRNSTKIIGF
jgi:hypothetical protein